MAKRVSKKELAQARALIKEYRGKLYLSTNLTSGAAGEVNLETRCISIARTSLANRQIFWSIILHEVGHLYCIDNNRYPIFHKANRERLTARDKRALVLTAWRAEQYVDQWALRELEKLYPELEYLGYDSSHKRWLHQNYLCYFKDQRFKKNRVYSC